MVQITSLPSEETHFSEVSSIPKSLALAAPSNFAKVSDGIFRSSCPTKMNHTFLAHLGIKSIVYFLPGEYPQENSHFIREKNISLFHFPTKSNRADRKMPLDSVRGALRSLRDPKNHPILVHCRQGKHRTGTVVGCLRKTQNWPLEEIFDEYHKYANDKPRIFDKDYIEEFPADDL